jgi:prepilin-type N-terminal cleavage/methylation domain-containing protein
MMKPGTSEIQASSDQRGFTLAEVIVAIALLSVVVVGLSGFGFISSRALLRSKELSVATIAAHERLDSLRSLPYASLVAGNTTTSMTSGKFAFTVQTTITVDTMPQVRMLKHVFVAVVNSHGQVVQQMTSSVYGGL